MLRVPRCEKYQVKFIRVVYKSKKEIFAIYMKYRYGFNFISFQSDYNIPYLKHNGICCYYHVEITLKKSLGKVYLNYLYLWVASLLPQVK